jgi:hypothetical protein
MTGKYRAKAEGLRRGSARLKALFVLFIRVGFMLG